MKVLVQGASRGLGLELVRQLLQRGEHVVATARAPDDSPGLVQLASPRLRTLRLDVTKEGDIEAAAEDVAKRERGLDLVLNVSGILHGQGLRPERRLEELDGESLHKSFAINAIGPALMGKHFRDLLCHGGRAVFASLSARIGSIADNGRGGWYAYRASKAAQNQLVRTMAHEFRRKSPQAIVVALHPGTVDTELSKPFRRSVPDHQLFPVDRAARQLLDIIDSLQPSENGSFLAWDRQPIPW
jgi:NAD(P)-dependent dehydrogenase (short-subunit alcohol dehydrogenase family)